MVDKAPAGDIRDAFFDELYKMAAVDRDVMFLTADMGAMSLERFKRDLPAQYMNVGVAEQNMVSTAAGLALAGKKVFIYAVSPFVTERCYEQIKVDLCTMRLPVTVIGSGPGISYNSDGPTHHATEDISIMRALPGMTILNPSDPASSAGAARLAYAGNGPVYVRIDKGELPYLYGRGEDFMNGSAMLKRGEELLIIATGLMVHKALRIADALSDSLSVGVADLYRIKPLNEKRIVEYALSAKRLVTLEEHTLIGGLGSAICETLIDNGLNVPLKRIGLRDEYCEAYGDREWMHGYYGLDDESIMAAIKGWV